MFYAKSAAKVRLFLETAKLLHNYFVFLCLFYVFSAFESPKETIGIAQRSPAMAGRKIPIRKVARLISPFIFSSH